MNIKLIALDMDGTLLQSSGALSDHSKKTLEYCIKNQIHIVVASGRAFHSLPEDVIEIPGVEYAITSNGAAIYRISDGKRIYSNILHKNNVYRIMEILQKYPIVLEAFKNGYAYTDQSYFNDPVSFGVSERVLSYIRRTRIPVSSIHSFIRENHDCLDNIDVISHNPREKEHIIRELQSLGDIYITSSVPHVIEIAAQTVSKAEALKHLAENLKLKNHEIMACGNADNDIEMIEFAGIGVAVKNASSDLLRAADYITDTNDREGVAEAIMKFVV